MDKNMPVFHNRIFTILKIHHRLPDSIMEFHSQVSSSGMNDDFQITLHTGKFRGFFHVKSMHHTLRETLIRHGPVCKQKTVFFIIKIDAIFFDRRKSFIIMIGTSPFPCHHRAIDATILEKFILPFVFISTLHGNTLRHIRSQDIDFVVFIRDHAKFGFLNRVGPNNFFVAFGQRPNETLSLSILGQPKDIFQAPAVLRGKGVCPRSLFHAVTIAQVGHPVFPRLSGRERWCDSRYRALSSRATP